MGINSPWFSARRLWWCTCWASSSSAGWVAMGSVKTQQWRLPSVLWTWSSGPVLGQERIRISSRRSSTRLAEIALTIDPCLEFPSSKEVEDGEMGLSTTWSNLKNPRAGTNPVIGQGFFSRWRLCTSCGTSYWVFMKVLTYLQDLAEIFNKICAMDCFFWTWGYKMRPLQLCGTCVTMKGVKCRKLWPPNMLICFFSPFHTLKKKTWQCI